MMLGLVVESFDGENVTKMRLMQRNIGNLSSAYTASLKYCYLMYTWYI